jgi:glycerophosphoryl diester phosphodiesterase
MAHDHRWLRERPIAHRGLHSDAKGSPENSLLAFSEACRRGFPIELDVRLTRDGRIAVAHDSNVKQPTGVKKRISDMTVKQLREVRIGGTKERVPLLEDVLALVNGQVPILIEIKNRGISKNLEVRVIDMIESYSGQIALESFNPLSISYLRHREVAYPLGQVVGSLKLPKFMRRVILKSLATKVLAKPDFLALKLDELSRAAVERWKQQGITVIAWPVKSEADEEYALKLADNFIFSGYEPTEKRNHPLPNPRT